MQANKISPAALCSNTLPGHPEMSVLSGHGLKGNSGGELESQQSQASLFGSEMANSMELFSQPYSASSHSSVSQHSQTHSSSLTIPPTGTQHSQDDGRGIQNVQRDSISGKPNSGGHNKYYMRYLSTTLCGKRQQAEAADCPTPTATSGRQGDTAHSNAAFEMWKSRQQERLEKQKLIEEVVNTSTLGYTKELKQTLENLRKEIKDALNLCDTSEKEKSQTEGMPHSELRQLLQGQAEIKEQLNDLKTLCYQQMTEIVALKTQVTALESHHATSLQSTLSTEISKLEKTLIKPHLDQLEVYLSQLSEQLKVYSHRSLPLCTKETENAQAECTSTPRSNTHNPTTHVLSQINPESQSGGSQLEKVQIKRKRKSSSVTRDHSLSAKTGNSHKVGGAQSQSDLSSSFDIDLTQCSPSGCSQVISCSVQKPIANNSVGQTASKKKALRSQQTVSPSGGPGAKRKRSNGRVSKKRSGSGRRGVPATPQATRRSGRLSKTNITSTGRAHPGISTFGSDGQSCVKQIKPELLQDKIVTVQTGGWDAAGGDVLEDWLDFKPPQVFGDTNPPSLPTHTSDGVKFHRSSEAAKRRLAITEQMSSTLAGSDSVLRELLDHSASSIHSP